MAVSTTVTAKARVGGAERAIRWMTTLSVVVLAVIAAIVSYKHVVVRRYGETSWTAALLPVSVDGMIAASSMTLLLDSRHGRRSGLLPWVLLVAGSAASLAANVAVAEPSMVGRLIAGWPSCALIGSYELLMGQIRHTAVRDTGRENVAAYVSHAASEVAHTGPHATGEVIPSALSPETAGSYGVPTSPVGPVGSSNEAHTDGPIDLMGASDADAARPVDDAQSQQPSRQRAQVGSTVGAQQRAWHWAVANRTPEGDLPPGKAIASQFGRSERWGRMVKQAGLAGQLDSIATTLMPYTALGAAVAAAMLALRPIALVMPNIRSCRNADSPTDSLLPSKRRPGQRNRPFARV